MGLDVGDLSLISDVFAFVKKRKYQQQFHNIGLKLPNITSKLGKHYITFKVKCLFKSNLR